jgi:hypothetical protein
MSFLLFLSTNIPMCILVTIWMLGMDVHWIVPELRSIYLFCLGFMILFVYNFVVGLMLIHLRSLNKIP